MDRLTRSVPFPLGPFQKYPGNPIVEPRGESWEAKDVFNPAAVVADGKVYLLYRAEDRTGHRLWNGTSRIGIAVSTDGIHFTRHDEPVLYPTEPYEQPGGCEDPRVTRVGDTYYMTYTAFDGWSAKLCLATSKDLFHWRKHGVLFPDWREGSDRVWSKSGAILADPIGGRYVMYFGDTSIWLAYSDDLIHWEPVLTPVLTPSADPAAFDSALVEPGPQPILTRDGILLIYNAARRVTEPGDPACGKLRYSAGQALLSLDNPARVIARTTEPFFTPETVQELSGQVDNVVFVEGLVQFRNAHYLYFGMADSRIGVATCDGGEQWGMNGTALAEAAAASEADE